jgi:hypothetical protein
MTQDEMRNEFEIAFTHGFRDAAIQAEHQARKAEHEKTGSNGVTTKATTPEGVLAEKRENDKGVTHDDAEAGK